MTPSTPRGIMVGFFCWDARDLAHDATKRWQVATATGRVLFSYATEAEAERKVDELVAQARANG